LLLLFQWYKQQAKEHSIKNNLLAVRRILGSVPNTEAATEALPQARQQKESNPQYA